MGEEPIFTSNWAFRSPKTFNLGRGFKEVVMTPNENAIARFPAARKMGRKQGIEIAEGEPKAKSSDNK